MQRPAASFVLPSADSSQGADPAAKQSALALVLANLVPLIGVLWLDWSTGWVLALYWAENVVIGLVTVMKIFTCRGGNPTWPSRLGNAAFFTLHYGAFALGHAIGLVMLVNLPGGAGGGEAAPAQPPVQVSPLWLGLTLAGMAASHVYEFVAEFLFAGRGRDKDLAAIATAPYPRLIILHVVVVLGAFASLEAGSAKPAVVLLVLLKTGLDLALHYGRRLLASGAS
ncbi:MAG: hypothetical protein KF847_16010 [Pirellulales bacterium]|nr:hypothetical protein [Pirellulales bacterium]